MEEKKKHHQPNQHLSTVQKQLLQVFPYWSPERYETVRKEKIGTGSNSFCGSLFRFVKEPKRRRKESPFGGLVVVGEWDLWDFSKTEVEDKDKILEELFTSSTFERFTCCSRKQEVENKASDGVVKASEDNNSDSIYPDSFREEGSEDSELLEAVQKFIKTCEDFGNLLSPIIWITPEQNGFHDSQVSEELYVSENLHSLEETDEKEEGEI